MKGSCVYFIAFWWIRLRMRAFESQLMPSISRFPFNVLRDPMYVGSTLCFAATALWWVPHHIPHFICQYLTPCIRYEKPAGLFVTFYVYIVYLVALRFEGYAVTNCQVCYWISSVHSRPFTDKIYSKREAERANVNALKTEWSTHSGLEAIDRSRIPCCVHTCPAFTWTIGHGPTNLPGGVFENFVCTRV